MQQDMQTAVEMGVTPQWGYGEGFQRHVVALCLKVPEFLSRNLDLVSPSFFENHGLSTLAYLMTHYFRKHEVVPSYEVMETQVNEHAVAYGGEKADDVRATLIGWLHSVWMSDPVKDEEYIQDRLVCFAQRQALRDAADRVIGMLEDPKKDDLSEAEGLVSRALAVGRNKDLGVDFKNVCLDLPQLIRSDPVFQNIVPTGFTHIDNRIGGVGAGEIAVVCGPPGRGKSTFLVTLGRNACMHFRASGKNKRVVHISLELKALMGVSSMYGACFTGLTRNDVLEGSAQYFERIHGQLDQMSDLTIKYFSPSSVGALDIKSYLSELVANTQQEIGLLIVDYADKLKCGENRYTSMSEVYKQLIAIGDKFACPVWTGSQINRNWASQETITSEGISDSWLKVADADLVLTLSQTPFEYEQKVCRVFNDKVRRGQGKSSFYCWHRGESSIIWEMTEEEVARFEELKEEEQQLSGKKK